jgi:hypothetical protein
LNLEHAGEQKIIQNDSINFDECLHSFKVEIYKRKDEPILFKECNLSNAGVRIDVHGQNNRS